MLKTSTWNMVTNIKMIYAKMFIKKLCILQRVIIMGPYYIETNIIRAWLLPKFKTTKWKFGVWKRKKDCSCDLKTDFKIRADALNSFSIASTSYQIWLIAFDRLTTVKDWCLFSSDLGAAKDPQKSRPQLLSPDNNYLFLHPFPLVIKLKDFLQKRMNCKIIKNKK